MGGRKHPTHQGVECIILGYLGSKDNDKLRWIRTAIIGLYCREAKVEWDKLFSNFLNEGGPSRGTFLMILLGLVDLFGPHLGANLPATIKPTVSHMSSWTTVFASRKIGMMR